MYVFSQIMPLGEVVQKMDVESLYRVTKAGSE